MLTLPLFILVLLTFRYISLSLLLSLLLLLLLSLLLLAKNIWKLYIWTVDKDVNMKVILAAIYTTSAVVKKRPKKNSGLYGFWTHDLCDTGAALYQQAN